MEDIILKCINIKKTLVEADEFDKGQRMLLNFGHTLGHAIEKYYNFDGISHGRAVAIGMCLMSQASENLNITKVGTTEKLKACLEKYGLETHTDVKNADLMESCLNDKKRDSDKINIIVCIDIGESEIINISIPECYKFLGVENV